MAQTNRRWRVGNLVLLAVFGAALVVGGWACQAGKAPAVAAAKAASATQPAVKPIKAPIDRIGRAHV